MPFTTTLARWTSGLRYQDLPSGVLPWVKAAVTDYLAVALAGCPAKGMRIIKDHARREYAPGPCSIIGDSMQLGLEGAALVNGTLAHWEEYDDATFGMSGHPSVVILPALFAAAQAFGGNGRDFAAAYVAGFEVCAKVGRLVNPQCIVLGYHPTAILGTLGAAAAVANLLRLDGPAPETALGLAATQSSGLRPHMGFMAKPMHAGVATRGGLAAALLARDGFTGARGVLEDAHGFANAFSGGKPGDFAALEAKIARPLEILDPGIAFKIFPSNFHTQAGIVAVLTMMREDGVRADEVESVLCLGNHMMQHSLWNDDPQSGLEGKLSLHYCLAAALVDGQLEVEQFTDERAADPRIRALLKKVRIEPHPAMAKLDFTKGSAFLGMEVVITLKSGRKCTRHITSGFSVAGVEGDGPHPDLLDKLARNARRVVSDERYQECVARIRRLETFDRVDALLAPLCGSALK